MRERVIEGVDSSLCEASERDNIQGSTRVREKEVKSNESDSKNRTFQQHPEPFDSPWPLRGRRSYTPTQQAWGKY